MTNYEKFKTRLNKKMKKNNITILGAFILSIFSVIGLKFPLDMIIIWIIVVISVMIYQFYRYKKTSKFLNTLKEEEKEILEKELITMFFENTDYALTENYIIDLKRCKLIPYKSIKAIQKIDKTYSNRGIRWEIHIKIYTEEGKYTYLSKVKEFRLGKKTEDEGYINLYEYIKLKNPNVEEKPLKS